MTPMQQRTISVKADFGYVVPEVKRSAPEPKRGFPVVHADAWGEGMTPMQQRTISVKADFGYVVPEVKRSAPEPKRVFQSFMLMRGGKV